MSGDLAPFGWAEWELKRGVLFNKNLNPRHHSWVPGQILITAWCDCPAHREHAKALSDQRLGADKTGPKTRTNHRGGDPSPPAQPGACGRAGDSLGVDREPVLG